VLENPHIANLQIVSRNTMMKQHDIKTFDDLCEKYSTWIIKYCSTTFKLPLFLVWYTDNDEGSTTKIMTNKSGNIFATNSLVHLKNKVKSDIEDLIVCDNIISWLENFGNLELVESCTFDIPELENEIVKNNLNIPTIESFANFINLFDDFVNQDLKYAKLQTYIDNELVKETWDYFYKYIFWPRFNDNEKFAELDIPKLKIDSKELLIKLKEVTKTFDDQIKLTENAI
jgi:hypothetical protein